MPGPQRGDPGGEGQEPSGPAQSGSWLRESPQEGQPAAPRSPPAPSPWALLAAAGRTPIQVATAPTRPGEGDSS